MTNKNRSWYKNLKQSKLTPPDKTFGIVWPILYALLLTYFILMLGEKKCVGICKPLIPFIIQIIINVFWSPVFFQLKKPLLAFIMILVMIVLTLLTIIWTLTVNKKMVIWLMPYFIWICFACYLNGYIVFNNH